MLSKAQKVCFQDIRHNFAMLLVSMFQDRLHHVMPKVMTAQILNVISFIKLGRFGGGVLSSNNPRFRNFGKIQTLG